MGVVDEDGRVFYMKPGFAYQPDPEDKGWQFGEEIDYSRVDHSTMKILCPHMAGVEFAGTFSWSELTVTFPDGCVVSIGAQERKPPPEDGIALG
jgi:hypothetical protein